MTFPKLLFPLIIFLLLTSIFSPAIFSADKTIIKEISDKAIYFDIPETAQYDETEAGLFIKKLDNYTAEAEIDGKKVRAYITDILRDYEIKPYAWVLLSRNERKEHKTEWDIISISREKPILQPTNTILLQPPSVERKTTASFPEVTLAPSSGPTPTTTTTTTTTTEELTITTSSALTGGVEGTAYSQTLSASGGTTPYMWSIVSGSLPSGLSLSSSGVISGTPSGNTPGTTYSFTVRVTDSVNYNAEKELNIKISGYNTIDWTQANTTGFGNVNNIDIWSMCTFGNYFYAGAQNAVTGCQIWRSSDGTTWTQVMGNGFGSASNQRIHCFTTFGNYLYAGTGIQITGGQIWRSSDGTAWDPVVGPAPATVGSGFGDANNDEIYSMTTFNGYIYAGTTNDVTGGQIWRSSDGIAWEEVVGDGHGGGGGFGSTHNVWISSIITFGGYIYAGTLNFAGTGGQIWRSSDGIAWEEVVGNGHGGGGGFGDTNNNVVFCMTIFGSYIYVGTLNGSIGGQIWCSSDGTTWTQANVSGFGSEYNEAITSMATFDSYIYAGVRNFSTGCEIWRSSDGTAWALANESGFGSVDNTEIYSMSTFGSYIYAGVRNLSIGGQIWRYGNVYVDPNITGRVYDSETNENISGAVVSIYPKDSTTALSSTTSNPYSFNVNDGYYYLRVEKEGYTFPSNTKNGVVSGDHGENFYASGTRMGIDIPIDAGYPLEITKTANKKNVVNGDIITYDIKIRNNSMWDLLNINIIDEITNGFKYISKSTYTDNTQLSETNININNRKATFKLINVPGHKETHLTYQVRVGSGISAGEYKTTAVAWDRVRDWRMSNETSCKVNVIYDALFTMGTIIGKVFYDVNGDGIQQKGEEGIPKAIIATEYGIVVETDEDGKYHIPAVPPGTHLLKVDSASIPASIPVIASGSEAIPSDGIASASPRNDRFRFTTENPYMVKITEGLLAKVNFGVAPLTPPSPQGGEGANQFFIVALGEGIVRGMDTSGNIDMVEQDDRYDKGVNLDGKLALYLKGKIKGKYLITLSIDTDRMPTKRGQAYQMRKLFTNLDPDKYYPVYGDASKIDYSANDTQDELYLLIEWDESFIKYGVFNTDIPLYNRTMQGLNVLYQSVKKTKFGDPYTKLNAFYARAYQIAAHDEFLGTGGSLYYIRHTPMIEGSEKVRVELRDEVSKEAIATAILTEEKDYEIDYDTGRIILKKPLSSVNYSYNASIISNDILSGARAYLIIDYEYESTGTIRREAYGIKASQQIGNHIRVGGTYIEEQKADNYYKLMGGDSTIKLNKDTEITGEYDRSENTQLSGAYSIDGGLSYDVKNNTADDTKTGGSVSVKGKTRLFNNTDINLGYTRQDKNFSATNTISTNGTTVYTGSILTRLKENLLIGLKHVTQEIVDATLSADLTGDNRVHTTTALLDYIPNKWDIRLEYQHQTVGNPFIDFTYAGYRQLMNDDIIGGRLGYKINDRIHPYIGGQVTVQNYINNQGYIGLEYQIWNNTNLNIKETIGNLGNSTLIGLTSQITPETLAYTNIEVGNNAQLGQSIKTTMGQKTQIDQNTSINWERDYSSYQQNILQGELVGYETKLTDTISLGANYERAQIEKEPTAISRDTGSITLSWLDIDHIKLFSKLELREDRGTDTKRQWLTQNNILYQLNQDISLIGRGNYSIMDNRTEHDTEAQFYETGVGIAYRPVKFDRLNFLGKYSYITNDSPESQNEFSQTQQDIRNIYAIEGAYDICRYLQLIGKFAMRDMSEKIGPRNWTDSQTYLYIGRLNFHVTNKWDIAGEYRTLANRQIQDAKSGWLLEVDRELAKYIRMGVGYNFTDYDDDLSNNDNWDAKGWFVRVNGKY